MKMLRSHLLRTLALAIVLAATAGCSTLQYRSVQSRFEDTVRADNERFSMPFTDAPSGYQAVADELTPAYIAGLDPKLRPNAWTLRAVSQWRAGASSEAVASALEGLAEIARARPASPHLENGRDSILLTMLPGLVEDSRLRQRFLEKGAGDVAGHYDEYAARFRTALRALAEARGKVAPATPPEVVHYWNYQCWRVLQNWASTIGWLPLDAQSGPNAEADAFVKATLGGAGFPVPNKLPEAIKALENALPERHPYRQLIELERQR